MRIGILGASRITPLSVIEPAAVIGARPVAIDERLFIDVRYPSGAMGAGGSDMSAESRAMALVVRGSRGEIEVPMFAVPHEDDTVVLRRPGLGDTVEHLGHPDELHVPARGLRQGAPHSRPGAHRRRMGCGEQAPR
jgi:hypothetical protein